MYRCRAQVMSSCRTMHVGIAMEGADTFQNSVTARRERLPGCHRLANLLYRLFDLSIACLQVPSQYLRTLQPHPKAVEPLTPGDP